jgi:hypothetical protein
MGSILSLTGPSDKPGTILAPNLDATRHRLPFPQAQETSFPQAQETSRAFQDFTP